ncbi:MAG: hypothetical protein JRE23_00325 [Deltaproteobacteria bacterium]|nr:hypothetical protein [Deltaproteobacteria bacterium]
MDRDNNIEQACNLSDLLEGKLDAFKSFLSATALLKDAADLQETEKIETLIAKRENCMKVIGEIDGRINKIRNFMPALPGGAVERVRAITKSIDDTVAEAAFLNKEFETIFMFHHNNLKGRLSKTHHSRDGIKNYALGAYGENQPRFLDVKS